MPRELEADGKQTVSLNDHKLQCQLCLRREKSWRPGDRQIPLPLPKAGESDKRTVTLGTQLVCCLTWCEWGISTGPFHIPPRGWEGSGAGQGLVNLSAATGESPREAGSSWAQAPLASGQRGPWRRDGIKAKIKFTNEAHGRSNFAITHSLLSN